MTIAKKRKGKGNSAIRVSQMRYCGKFCAKFGFFEQKCYATEAKFCVPFREKRFEYENPSVHFVSMCKFWNIAKKIILDFYAA